MAEQREQTRGMYKMSGVCQLCCHLFSPPNLTAQQHSHTYATFCSVSEAVLIKTTLSTSDDHQMNVKRMWNALSVEAFRCFTSYC